MGFGVLQNPRSQTVGDKKNPTAAKGTVGSCWATLLSAPQNVHGPKANDGLGYDGNVDGDEMKHV